MLRRHSLLLLAFLLVAGGFTYGLVRLFALRSETGDTFPVHSTLRKDPLGAKVLFDSLQAIPGLEVERNLRPLVRLRPAQPVTLLYLNLTHEAIWEKDELEYFQALVATGSRAVFAFSAVAALRPEEKEDKDKEKKEDDEGKAKPDESPEKQDAREKRLERARRRAGESGTSFEKVATQWGFAFETTRLTKSEADALRKSPTRTPAHSVAALKAANSRLEPELPWHSALHFKDVQAPWKTIYELKGKPVLIERPWGRGSIVLATDGFFLSNEALRSESRAPRLLSWLTGSPRRLIFDEEHLGVSEDSGVATLARQYRLHGLVAGLGLLVILFLWQNFARFVPPLEDEATDRARWITGRSSQEGFLSLLRRSVPQKQLLETCVAEWRRAFSHDTKSLEHVEAHLIQKATSSPKPADTLATYQAITTSLKYAGRKTQNQSNRTFANE